MSHKLCALIRSKRCGSVVRKAVLGALADRADDGGLGIYASARTLAGLADVSVSTLHTTLLGLTKDSLVRRVGTRKCRSGHTVEYAIDIVSIGALPDVEANREPETYEAQSAPKTDARYPGAGELETIESTPGAGDLEQQGIREPDARYPGAGDKPSLNHAAAVGGKLIWEELADAIDHPMLDPHKATGLVTTGAYVAKWIAAGADMQLDIVPTIRSMLERRDRPVTTWRWFDAAVREAAARRIEIDQQPTLPIKANVDVRRGKPQHATISNPKHTELLADLRAAGEHEAADNLIAALTDRTLRGFAAATARDSAVRFANETLNPDWTQRLALWREHGDWNAVRWGPEPGQPGCRVPTELLIPSDAADAANPGVSRHA